MLPASFMQMETFWYSIAYMINLCIDRVLFSLGEFILVNAVECWRAYTKGICNLHDEFEETEVDHIDHNFAPKYCHLKLAGSIMKYWLQFYHNQSMIPPCLKAKSPSGLTVSQVSLNVYTTSMHLYLLRDNTMLAKSEYNQL